MVVIADAKGVESLAGIMGGEDSGCDETTTDVLIESALWDPANIARSGRQLGIVSDARYRFERGVDPAFCLPGLDYETVVKWLSSPLVAVPMLLLTVNVFWHLRLGLQVVIEDYQHDETRVGALILLNFYAIALAALSIFSILKIAFRGTAG